MHKVVLAVVRRHSAKVVEHVFHDVVGTLIAHYVVIRLVEVTVAHLIAR